MNGLYLKLSYRELGDRLSKKLRDYVKRYGLKKIVVGLSGGLDSSVTCALAVKALGNGKVIGVLMPSRITSEKDIEDAVLLAKQLKIRLIRVNLANTIKKIINLLTISDLRILDVVDIGNITARLRMITLYSVAKRVNGLVVGTGDKSEAILGYFTKFGDGGVDVLPIGNLYKTQVRELARELKVPKRIIEKPSSPNLWRNQTAEGELGLAYENVDTILSYLLDKKYTVSRLIRLGIKRRDIKKVLKMKKISEHKRIFPPIF